MDIYTFLFLSQVGKKDQLKKFRETGNPNAVNTLNRRNLDIAMQEWARMHRDKVGGAKDHDQELAKVSGSGLFKLGSNRVMVNGGRG